MQNPATLSQLPSHFIVPLPHYQALLAEGEQAGDFLNGQLSINVKRLDAHRARRCAHCDAKGKAWSVPLIVGTQDRLYLLAQQQAAEASLQQFKKYAVFSKVSFHSLVAPLWQQFFVVSSSLKQWLLEHFGTLPEEPMDTVTGDLGVVIYQPQLAANGYHLLLSESGVAALQQFLQQQPHTALPVPVYEALCIQAGVPDVSGDNINQFVPQMVNMQLLDAIDFDKGCYIGQEVIARTRYLGKNKRAALVFRWPEATNVEIGATVEKQLGEHWRSAGTVVRCATLGAETWIMAVVANDTGLDEVHRLSGCLSGPTFTAIALLGQ